MFSEEVINRAAIHVDEDDEMTWAQNFEFTYETCEENWYKIK